MKKDQIFRRHGVNVFAVDKAMNIHHSLNLHSDYTLHAPDVSKISDNGLLDIFELIPTDNGLPRFRARWDQNKELVDIDILNVDRTAFDDFRGERNGYSGHHPLRISTDERRFEVKVAIPNKDICSGWIVLNINWGHGVISFG